MDGGDHRDVSRARPRCPPATGPTAHLVQKRNGALFGVTAQINYVQGTIFELVPPKAGSSAWKKRILDDTHTNYGSIGLLKGGVLYGTDYIGNTVWSLVPRTPAHWASDALPHATCNPENLDRICTERPLRQ
jgi:hypothetical protein